MLEASALRLRAGTGVKIDLPQVWWVCFFSHVNLYMGVTPLITGLHLFYIDVRGESNPLIVGVVGGSLVNWCLAVVAHCKSESSLPCILFTHLPQYKVGENGYFSGMGTFNTTLYSVFKDYTR